MNDRKRQIAKVLRAQARREKEARAWLAQDKFMNAVSDAIRAFGDAAVKCANAMAEWLASDGVRRLLDAAKRYNEEQKMKKTCRTCKHCIWATRGGRKVMSCKEYSTTGITVLCEPPNDEACGKYEEVDE